jgi:hypothetical protein
VTDATDLFNANLPYKCYKEMENHISNEEATRLKLKKIMTLELRDKLQDSATAMVDRVLCRTQLVLFTYQGRGNKKAFKSLRFCNLVREVLRLKFSNVSEQRIDQAITKTVKYAKQRHLRSKGGKVEVTDENLSDDANMDI